MILNCHRGMLLLLLLLIGVLFTLSCAQAQPRKPHMPVAAPGSLEIVSAQSLQEPEASPTPKSTEQETAITFRSAQWDPPFTPSECTAAEAATPLMAEALTLARLDIKTVGFSTADIQENDFFLLGYYSDKFVLPWHKRIITQPLGAGCFAESAADALDYYAEGPHPVANSIRHAAKLLGRSPNNDPPFTVSDMPKTFKAALARICETSGGCGTELGDLPLDLKQALIPILWTINEGLEARYAMDEELFGKHDPAWWNRYGGTLLLVSFSALLNKESIDPANESDRNYLLGEIGRRKLYEAASQIAYAIEHTDWSPFVGRMGVTYDITTEAGKIIIRDGGNQEYQDTGEDVLFFLDLGGSDRHFDPIASNTSGKNAVSIAIDLAGNDHYTYNSFPTKYDRPDLPAADADGRLRESESYGNVSLSEVSRQGGARNGIAMLFDFGDGNDLYQSLRASQGYAHLGVGVLLDAGGCDTYFAENGVQGSAQFGIGILMDLGNCTGKDQYFSFVNSQGFGYVGGVGIAFNERGDGLYSCDIGIPKYKGIPLYSSPQLPGESNASFCQGAGSGRRAGADQPPEQFLSGGIGILRDKSGSDKYYASVFAQGTGFWRGIGLLSDGGGADTFNALWYVQGASAHFAIGVFVDEGAGNDIFQGLYKATAMSLGAGHDLSVGVFINETGDDVYSGSNLSLGASNCNGIGIFIDNGGEDDYLDVPKLSMGLGNVSNECIGTRSNGTSIGIFIDGGGDSDTYEHPIAQNASKWTQKAHNLPSEYGVGIDGNGNSGIHAGGNH